MSENRPQGRRKNVTGAGTGIGKTGENLGGGPVGSGSRPTSGGGSPVGGRPSGGQQSGQNHGHRASGSGGGGMNPIILIIIAAIVLLGGGGGLSGLFGGGGDGGDSGSLGGLGSLLGGDSSQIGDLLGGQLQTVDDSYYTATPRVTQRPTATPRPTATVKPSAVNPNSWYALFSGAQNHGSTSTSTDSVQLNTQQASGVRGKYTKLVGNGDDTVTLMIYMCGTDLESKGGMATKDLNEIAQANYGEDVQIIVYTGGCNRWHVNGISSSVNQIWRIRDGRMENLVKDDGSAAMTNSDNLSRFIKYCAKNYPASRYQLILWDHGGGSVSGYGYDEKTGRTGAMSLAGLNTALKDGGVKFDFIGFDACLMATVETALMCANYGDYMIASEESEPGIGWYYTNWLSTLGRNTSTPTLELGKQICDDFTNACKQQCPGQQTTLSVVDLAELSATVPPALTSFAKSISGLIANKDYTTVSNARNGSREFARSSRIDQVDLTDLANNMGTDEGAALSRAIQSSVKYNRVSGMTNAYGLSIYFPYQKVSNVDRAVDTYRQIGMDDSYGECIRAFASVEASGQAAYGGFGSPYGSLSGSGYSSAGGDLLGELLGSFLGGSSGSTSSGFDFLFSGRSLSDSDIISFVTDNSLDAATLIFSADANGQQVLHLSDSQRSMLHSIDRNVFLDDGTGYVDLGLDNTYSWNADGDLVADTEATWLAIGTQVAPYYHLSDEADGSVYGYIPATLNDERVQLLVHFAPEGTGLVVGYRRDYRNGETDTVAKSAETLEDGDVIRLICDFYSYDETFSGNYTFGQPLTVNGPLFVSDVTMEGQAIRITYRLTDIYNQCYWTNTI